jgi:hypothetical protein
MDKIQDLGDSKCETSLSKMHRAENTKQFSAGGDLNLCRSCTHASEDELKESPKHVRQK